MNSYIGINLTSIIHLLKSLSRNDGKPNIFEVKNYTGFPLNHCIWSPVEIKLMEEWIKCNLSTTLELTEECLGCTLDINGKSIFFGANGLYNVLEILRKVEINFPQESLKSEYDTFYKTGEEFIKQQVVFNKSNHISRPQIYESLPPAYRKFFDAMGNDQKIANFWREISYVFTGIKHAKIKEDQTFFFLLRILLGVNFLSPVSVLESVLGSKVDLKVADSIFFKSLGSKTLEIKIDGYDGRFTSEEGKTYAASGNFTLPSRGVRKSYVQSFNQRGREVEDKYKYGCRVFIWEPVGGKEVPVNSLYLPSLVKGMSSKKINDFNLSILHEETGCIYGVMPFLSYLFSQ